MFDILHIKHLGVDQYFLGSVAALLVTYIMEDSLDANIRELDMLLRAYWEDDMRIF